MIFRIGLKFLGNIAIAWICFFLGVAGLFIQLDDLNSATVTGKAVLALPVFPVAALAIPWFSSQRTMIYGMILGGLSLSITLSGFQAGPDEGQLAILDILIRDRLLDGKLADIIVRSLYALPGWFWSIDPRVGLACSAWGFVLEYKRLQEQRRKQKINWPV